MENKNVITLTLSPDDQDRLYAAWQEYASRKLPAYARFQLRPENCVITCYNTGRTVFQGKDASVYAAAFNAAPAAEIQSAQAGSDEVGTGDYLGPVCVAAVIVQPAQFPLLQSLGIRDSKALKDEDIRELAPKIMKELTHTLLIVEPSKYNEVHTRDNMNAIKAKLHNQAYLNLMKKAELPALKIIDQFTPEPIYYHYLKNTRNIVRGIHFETKAEDKYPAVGAASVLARYAFLTRMDTLEKEYDMPFAKGGGAQADKSAVEFCRRYGYERLPEIAKMHFKNTERVRSLLRM